MSGDSINSLKMVKEQPLNLTDLEYTKRLLQPFEDIVIERFNGTNTNNSTSCSNRGLFVLVAIGLVLLLNFPKVRERSGLNDYVLWLISAFLLFGVIY